MTSKSCDASDMFAVHDAMRRTFVSEGGAFVRAVDPSDAARFDAVVHYLEGMLALIHAHHESEDALVWPKLLQRAPEHVETIALGESQHAALGEAMSAVESTLEAWKASRDDAGRSALAEALEVLGARLSEHLDYEEAQLVPLIEAHITFEEWAQMPGASLSKLDGSSLWIGLGAVRDHLPQVLRDLQERHAPRPLWEAWLKEGEPYYRSTVGRARGLIAQAQVA